MKESAHKSSIHIEPVLPSSESHNKRLKEFDYVRSELSSKNESWEVDSIPNRLEEVKKLAKEKTGRKMQEKATPIREGVFLFDKHHTIEDAKQLAKKIEEQFGISAFQIHMHRDEGRWINGEGKTVAAFDDKGELVGADVKPEDAVEWIPNLHGHIIFDWMDHSTGKSWKLNGFDMSNIQTVLAKELKMQRGQKSSKQNLSALQYKNMKEQEALDKAIEAREGVEKVLKNLDDMSDEIIALNALKMVDKEKTIQNIKGVLLENDNMKNLVKAFQNQSKSQKDQLVIAQGKLKDSATKWKRVSENFRSGLEKVLEDLLEGKTIDPRFIEQKLGINKGEGGSKGRPSELEY